ncbi:MAG: hypothetical protein AB1921_08335 [Thermodesulfobacteriota bacterium]
MDKSPDGKNFSTQGGSEQRPSCFGDLARVFPMGTDGLRQSPEECLACALKTSCLAAAAAEERARLGRERLDREVAAGETGFLARWSRKKHLHRIASRRNRSTAPDRPKET